MTKEKLVEAVNADFEKQLPGVNFNFSQYIQDNIEEAIVGCQRIEFGQDRRAKSKP